MKKSIALLLMATLLLCAMPLSAVAAEATGAVVASIDALYADYLNRHEFDTVHGADEGSAPVQFTAVIGPPDSIIGSSELLIPENQAVPKNNKQRGEMFLQLFSAARAITETVPEMQVVDTNKIENVYGSKVHMRLLPEKWWKTYTDGDRSLCVGPLTMLDTKDQVIDDTFYGVCGFFGPDETRIWLVSDVDLVCKLFSISGIPSDEASMSNAFRAWMTDLKGYTLPMDSNGRVVEDLMAQVESATADELRALEATMPPRGAIHTAYEAAQTRAWLATLDIIGTVTIRNDSSINVRADDTTDSEIIGKAPAKQSYDCIAITDSGWYQIVYGQAVGFVSQRMSEFVAK